MTNFICTCRLYLDGRNLNLPKPVVINELNPIHQELIDQGLPNTNDAHLDFEEVLLQNRVS